MIMRFGLFVAVLFLGSVLAFRSERYGTQMGYRADYTYNWTGDAYYKLHTNPEYYWKAKLICKMEGAELMGTPSEQDTAIVRQMMNTSAIVQQMMNKTAMMNFTLNPIENYIWVYDEPKNQSITNREILHCIHFALLNCTEVFHPHSEPDSACVANSTRSTVKRCYPKRPFVCKVNFKEAVRDQLCEVFGTGYLYNASVNGCYKMSREIHYDWDQAYNECQADDAHLIVLNSEEESLFVKDFLASDSEFHADNSLWHYHAGVRAKQPTTRTYSEATWKPKEFKTIFNQTLAEAGFSEWSGPDQSNWTCCYCLTVNGRDGKYYSGGCGEEKQFICEKEVKPGARP